MSCSWCKKKDYFVMKIPCNHYICLSCLKTHSNCNICKKQIIQHSEINKTSKTNNSQESYEDSYVSWYDTMYDYDNGII